MSFEESYLGRLRRHVGSAEHRLVYPNGDVVHAFALCFAARDWEGEIRPDPPEVSEWGVYALASPPAELQRATALVLDLYARFRETGDFQAS